MIPMVQGVELRAPSQEGQKQVLTTDALQFIVELQRKFNARRVE